MHFNNSDHTYINLPFFITYFQTLQNKMNFILTKNNKHHTKTFVNRSKTKSVKKTIPMHFNNSDHTYINLPFYITYFQTLQNKNELHFNKKQ